MSLILGIETSCDETAAAVVADGRRICSNVVASQTALHAQYGGVFPEMASREHVAKITPVVQQALSDAHTTWAELDAIAVTYGPGLAGSLLVGVNMAKGLALAKNLPLIGINHLEGHIYASWLDAGNRGHGAEVGARFPATNPPLSPVPQSPSPRFPLVCLIVSGGHTELILMRAHGQYQLLGATRDDAAGEAFDKVARLLGLGYPGGPVIQKAAEQGDPRKLNLPRAWLADSLDFSFSGLKTAVLNLTTNYARGEKIPAADARAPISDYQMPITAELTIADLAAAFQEAVVEVLVEKTRWAAERFDVRQVLIGGGVAANQRLRAMLQDRLPVPVHIPPFKLCTDNGAVIASAGHFHFVNGQRSGWDLDVVPGLRLAHSENKTMQTRAF